MGVFVEAVVRALSYWPLLGLVVGAQLLHELVHFAVAWACGAGPIIRIRLRSPMSVVWDAEAVTEPQRALIGLMPTVTGLSAAIVMVAVVGWPAITPTTVVGAVAWYLYTMPSRDDVGDLAAVFEPSGGWKEPQRSWLIGGAVMAGAQAIQLLPYPTRYTRGAMMGIVFGAVVYMALAFLEHGYPDESMSAE